MKTIQLNHGVEIPALGFGVFRFSPTECDRCVLDAIGRLDQGEKLINDFNNDTDLAQMFLGLKPWN